MKTRWIEWIATGMLVSCGGTEAGGSVAEEAPRLVPMEERVAEECGRPLDEEAKGVSYEELLQQWTARHCAVEFGVRQGTCQDGKRFLLYLNRITSQIRYFEGSQLVGIVDQTDVGTCPSDCPDSKYSGSLSAVTCQVVEYSSVCPEGADASIDIEDVIFPFSDGQIRTSDVC